MSSTIQPIAVVDETVLSTPVERETPLPTEIALLENPAAASRIRTFLPTTYDDLTQTRGVEMMYDGDPQVWGGTWWRMMHLIAYYYPEEPTHETQQATFQQFDAWRFTLPCGNCLDGYRVIWNQIPLRNYLATRALLIEWSILVHDAVNARLGVPPLDFPRYMTQIIGPDAVIVDDNHNDIDNNNRDEIVEKKLVDDKSLIVAALQQDTALQQENAVQQDTIIVHNNKNGPEKTSITTSKHADVAKHPATTTKKDTRHQKQTKQQQQKTTSKCANGPTPSLAAMASMVANARTRQEQQFALQQQNRFDRYGVRQQQQQPQSQGQSRFSIPPPRDCPNCNRKSGPLTPSIF